VLHWEARAAAGWIQRRAAAGLDPEVCVGEAPVTGRAEPLWRGVGGEEEILAA
jgi:hypothetical protein